MLDLVQNAVDVTPAGGDVCVSVPREGGWAALTVDDSGPGINVEAEEYVFEPFFPTKPEGVGTGLGLAIAESIMSAHGGKLRIGRSDLGGARLEARLPVAEAADGGPASGLGA